jgi:hypothetical protein
MHMKYAILAAVTAVVVGAAATAHAEDQGSLRGAAPSVGVPAASAPAVSIADQATASSRASLAVLLADWERAGFNPPSKPSQYRVYGRNGYVTSGPGYNAMAAEIRSAVIASQRGDDHETAEHIAQARILLASVAPSTATRAKG